MATAAIKGTNASAGVATGYGRASSRDDAVRRSSTAGVARSDFDQRTTVRPLSAANLLADLIERMGGAAGSRAKGSYVNLRV